ncbi:hypothetical protein LJC59_04120, partial [Desulfovibrio sp. OttesenSCG-928-A18]|nr:hypothetical protein [Desulfovibrio sp. OttesenSCG-928-A18]
MEDGQPSQYDTEEICWYFCWYFENIYFTYHVISWQYNACSVDAAPFDSPTRTKKGQNPLKNKDFGLFSCPA